MQFTGGILRLDVDEARNIHLLFDHHAIVLANAVPSESLFHAEQIHEGLSARDVVFLRSQFPSKELPEMMPSRLCVQGPKLRKLLERHLRNNRPLLKSGIAEYAEDEDRLRA